MPRRKDNPEPWERQIGESSKAFAGFQHYMLAGVERSINKTKDALNRTHSQIAGWAKRKHWLERVHAWEDVLAEKRRVEAEEAIQKMYTRHTVLAMKVQAKINETLDKMAEGSYPKGQIANALAKATEIERISRGEPATVEEIREKSEPDYSQLSDEAFEEVKRVIREDEDRQGDQEGRAEEEPPQVH